MTNFNCVLVDKAGFAFNKRDAWRLHQLSNTSLQLLHHFVLPLNRLCQIFGGFFPPPLGRG